MYALNACDQFIGMKMIDSELTVKREHRFGASLESEYESESTANLLVMQSNRDTVLSDFVRMKIREWEAEGRQQKDLAEIAGFNKSTVAQVKKGTGVGAKTAPGFARALGFRSVDSMVDAAYAWRQGSGDALDRRLADPGVMKAFEMLPTVQPDTSPAQWRAIVGDFLPVRFDGRDAMWWLETIAKELQFDRQRSTVERRSTQRDERGRIAAEERAWREAASLRRQVTEEPPSDEPAPVTEAPTRRRRRAAS